MARDSGEGHGWEGGEDDWFAEKGELDWLDDPHERPAAPSARRSPTPEQGGDAGARRGRDAGPEGTERDSRQPTRALIARRRLLGLLAAGLVVAAVIAVVIVTSGGGSSTETVSTASTPPPATETAASSTQPTRPVQTEPTPSSTPAKVTLPASGKLSIGDTGSAVVALQRALIQLGFNLGKPDGAFGSMTQEAVATFQTAHGLTPDGIVGATTATKLNELLASGSGRG